MCCFLYVVSNNHTSILHSNGDNEPQRYCGSDLDHLDHVTLPDMWPFDFEILGSRDVIGHVTVQLPMGVFV